MMASPARNRPDLTTPPPRDLVLLAVAVLAVSSSAPIIAACGAPALAIAFWRCLLGSGATGLWVLLRQRKGLGQMDAAAWRGSLIAGAFLAAHFAAWIPSLRFTSVASSTALVATQPVWAALIARWRGVRVDGSVWIGIGIALVGVVVLTGIDFALDPRSLIGDALALLGGILAAAYVSVGERVRQHVPTATYTMVVYGASAAALLPLAIVTGSALTGYSTRDWALILALTGIAQLLGHTLINAVLATTSATVTSLAILFELPGAVIIAALWLGTVPPPVVYPALVLILVGLYVVIRGASRAGGRPPLPTSPDTPI